MYFYEQAGLLALGSRLRRLGDILANDARELFALYAVDLDPRWFPVFHTLTLKDQASVTELAADVGQTHPAVSQVVRQMGDAGLVKVTRDGADSRKRIVSLTDSGRETARRLEPQCRDVESAVTELIEHVGGDFWRGIERMEALLLESSMAERVRGVRKRREMGNVTIVPFNDAHAAAFRELNLQWIRKHWAPEPADFKALDNPRAYIIDNGGHIAIALDDRRVMGTCALVRMSQDSYELAKMAVADEARGKGVGLLLGQSVIAKARELGATRVYLESNTVLKPAIALYRKLGFTRVAGPPSPYSRCNIQMELRLDAD